MSQTVEKQITRIEVSGVSGFTLMEALKPQLGSDTAVFDLMGAGRVFLNGKARRHRHLSSTILAPGDRVEVRMKKKLIEVRA